MKRKKINLAKIRIDGETQPRAGINTALVAEYAEIYEAGGSDFPPVIVFFDGVDYWMADGFHRWHAAKKAELEGIYCEIHDGTVEDARWYSYAANQTHGQRRTTADKQKAVKAALLHPKGAGMSDSQIAEYVGVDHKTVARHRNDLGISQVERTGRDGRTIDTTNIGKPTACPNCAATELDEDGDCAQCHEPAADEPKEDYDLEAEATQEDYEDNAAAPVYDAEEGEPEPSDESDYTDLCTAIADEAEEIAKDLGNHARMADFIGTIRDMVRMRPIHAMDQLDTIETILRNSGEA